MADGSDLTEILEAQASYRVAALLAEPAADTTDPTAREWLRRWGASGIQPKPQTCACSTGNCRICN